MQFSVEAHSPVPFMHCYCSICRKTAGSGGYGINLGAYATTLRVSGQAHVAIYHAVLRDSGEHELAEHQRPKGAMQKRATQKREKRSPAGRHFCRECGSALWLWDPRWPELVHPHASAIDTPLPKPPEVVQIGLAWAPGWVDVPEGAGHVPHPYMPGESLEDWHQRHGLWSA